MLGEHEFGVVGLLYVCFKIVLDTYYCSVLELLGLLLVIVLFSVLSSVLFVVFFPVSTLAHPSSGNKGRWSWKDKDVVSFPLFTYPLA